MIWLCIIGGLVIFWLIMKPSQREWSADDDLYSVGRGAQGWRNLPGANIAPVNDRWHDADFDVRGVNTTAGSIKLRNLMASEIGVGDRLQVNGTLMTVIRSDSNHDAYGDRYHTLFVDGSPTPINIPSTSYVKGVPSWER